MTTEEHSDGEATNDVEIVEGDIVDAEPTVGEIVEGDIVSDLATEPTAIELGIDLPDDGDAAQSLLLRHLMEARQEAGEYLESLQRVAADFENYRKRVARDHAATVQRAGERVIKEILPALDNFDAALAYETQTTAEEKILDGIRGTYDALLTALGKEGLERIEAGGAVFDTAVHEAIGGDVGGDGELVVSQELRRGYTLAGRVIRPSLVMVEHA
jgi:molecular chaperone GrpE